MIQDWTEQQDRLDVHQNNVVVIRAIVVLNRTYYIKQMDALLDLQHYKKLSKDLTIKNWSTNEKKRVRLLDSRWRLNKTTSNWLQTYSFVWISRNWLRRPFNLTHRNHLWTFFWIIKTTQSSSQRRYPSQFPFLQTTSAARISQIPSRTSKNLPHNFLQHLDTEISTNK